MRRAASTIDAAVGPLLDQRRHLHRLGVVDHHVLHVAHVGRGKARVGDLRRFVGAQRPRRLARRAGLEDRRGLRGSGGSPPRGEPDQGAAAQEGAGRKFVVRACMTRLFPVSNERRAYPSPFGDGRAVSDRAWPAGRSPRPARRRARSPRPQSWLVRRKSTRFQTLVNSGWWSTFSACIATRVRKAKASAKSLNVKLRTSALPPSSSVQPSGVHALLPGALRCAAALRIRSNRCARPAQARLGELEMPLSARSS